MIAQGLPDVRFFDRWDCLTVRASNAIIPMRSEGVARQVSMALVLRPQWKTYVLTNAYQIGK